MSYKNYKHSARQTSFNTPVTTLHGTVVRTLFVGNLHPKSTVNGVQTFFSQFGPIEKVSIKAPRPDDFGLRVTFGFITFEKPEDAARCLSRKSLNFFHRTIYVNIADIWHQPGCSKENNSGGANEAAQSSEDEACGDEEENLSHGDSGDPDCPIAKLNDDCLLYIFDCFSIEERPVLSRVCRRWRHLMNNYWDRFQNLDYVGGAFSDLSLTENKLQLHLHLCRNITSVNICVKNKALSSNAIAIVAQNCDKLEELSIGYLNLEMRPLALVAHSCLNLKKLSMTECNVKVGELGLVVSKCKRLEFLFISSCLIKHSHWLKKLSPGLKTLALLECNVQPEHLAQGLSNVRSSLTDLIITSRPREILSRFFTSLDLTTLPNLRTLCLKGSVAGEIECDPKKLKNLKHLELEFNHSVNNLFLSVLVESSPPIEALNLSGSLSDSLTEHGLMEITKLTQLKYLNLSNICDVNDAVLLQVCKELKNLTSLGLYLCNDVSNTTFKRIVTDLQNLTELDVSLCLNFNENSVIAAENAADKNPLKPTLNILAAKSGLSKDTIWNHPRVTVSFDMSSHLNWVGFWGSASCFNKYDVIPPELINFPFDNLDWAGHSDEDDFDEFDDDLYEDIYDNDYLHRYFDSEDSDECPYFNGYPFDNVFFIG